MIHLLDRRAKGWLLGGEPRTVRPAVIVVRRETNAWLSSSSREHELQGRRFADHLRRLKRIGSVIWPWHPTA